MVAGHIGKAMNAKYLGLSAACLVVFALAGCAYTSKTNLPEHIKTIHVPQVPNRIDITGDVSNRTSFKVYRPGLEIDLRNALIERFIFDGHLKVADREKADAVLEAELIDFRRDPLRYNKDDSIQEFRVNVTASISFRDLKDDKTIWSSPSISGNSSYFLSGRVATTEDQAVAKALEDLARHVVEEVLEIW